MLTRASLSAYTRTTVKPREVRVRQRKYGKLWDKKNVKYPYRFVESVRVFSSVARVSRVSEFPIGAAEPEVDNLLVLLGDLRVVVTLLRNDGEFLPERDVLIDEVLSLR